MCSNSYNERTSSISVPDSKSELVDNLLVMIQNIVAETASVSKKVLSETSLQWKIKLFSNSPVIILQYELQCDENERVQMVPVVDYKEMDVNSGTVDDTYIINHENIITSSALHNLKQEVPELLLDINIDEEIKDKSIEDNHAKATFTEINIGTGSIPYFMNNFSESVGSSSGKELIAVTVSDLCMATLQTEEEEHGNCDDERHSKTSEGIGNDNGMGRMKGKSTKEHHKRINASEKHFTHSPNPTECNKTLSRENCFTCEECGKSFTQSRYLMRHKKIHAGQIFICDVCGKSCTTSSALTCHKRIHTGEKPFKCGQCGKSFTFSSTLTCHKRIHSDEKPFKCEICGEFFKDSSYLYRHKKSHTGIKPYKCEVCGKSFKTSSEVTVHKRIHTGEKPFECDVCGKSCTTSSQLISHKRTHSEEKSFKCDICGKLFSFSNSLIRHKIRHTRVKYFTCKHCEKSFPLRRDLLKHYQTHSK